MNCQGCGTESDRLRRIDCEPTAADGAWKQVEVCGDCLVRLDADMWINERGWAAIDPVVPFASLPPARVQPRRRD